MSGIHPASRKEATRHLPIEDLPAPAEVRLPLHQHAGAPAVPVVEKRANLAIGDLVGEAPAALGARVHASIAGHALPLTAALLPNGRRALAVGIRAAGADREALRFADAFAGPWDLPEVTPEEIVRAVRSAGIVGLGGASFPSHVKLQRDRGRPVDTVVANGAECEPYLTGDERVMIEAPGAVVAGLALAMRAVGAERGVVAVEDDKVEAIGRLGEELARGHPGVSLAVRPAAYPTGDERQLVRSVLGRVVPAGGLPLDVGAVVFNVQTAAAIARAVLRGASLTHRVLTVGGPGISRPRNLFVPIGASVGDLVEACGGLSEDACRVVAGGPMMGFTVSDLSVPVTKGTTGIVALTGREVPGRGAAPCIRCGRCLEVCPRGLAPTRIARAASAGDLDLARRWDLEACVECGCCAWACPSGIPLVQQIRAGKAGLRRRMTTGRP